MKNTITLLFLSLVLFTGCNTENRESTNQEKKFNPEIKISKPNLFFNKKTSTELTKIKGIVRYEQTDINISVLPQKISSNSSIRLNLFDKTTYIANITQITKSKETTTWSGNIVDMPYSHVSIAITNGIVAGSIRTNDGSFFKIIYNNDTQVIQEIDKNFHLKLLEPLVPKIDKKKMLKSSKNNSDEDSGDTIDIMVLYTATARDKAGGTNAIKSIINSAVATMNTTFENSNINPRVRLVHTEEVSYTHGENGSGNGFNIALDDLTDTDDGYLDYIHDLRNTHRADMVQLLFNNTSSGGLAWVMTDESHYFEKYAFSVVHYAYADGHSFDHEFGHNMGMAHDRDHASGEGANSYSYGYQSPSSSWRTVMSYNCTSNCPRVDHWSNPNITYDGESTGIAIGATNEADGHTSINDCAKTIANWRVSDKNLVDLLISNLHLNKRTLGNGQSFKISFNVENKGGVDSTSSKIHYYISKDSTISNKDSQLSVENISEITSNASISKNKSLSAPTKLGTYYIGVCIDPVDGEGAIANNCSNGVKISVKKDTDRDGVVDSVDKDDDNDGISDVDEKKYGFNPLDSRDAQKDYDNDGFSNVIEISLGSNPKSAKVHPIWTPIMVGTIITFVPSFK